jgi:hypothetical protein
MKKLLIIAGIVALVVVIALIILPMIFKPQLVQLVEDQMNKNLNARLDLGGIGLNLFQDFPNLTLKIDDPVVVNNAPFEGDTLARMDDFRVSIDLGSLIFGKSIRVVSVLLDEPMVNLRVLKDGAVNWDIAVPGEVDTTAAEPGTGGEFAVTLQSYEIRDAALHYVDEMSGVEVRVDDLSHKGSGDFTQDIFKVRTETDIAGLTLGTGGIKYLSNVPLRLKADIDVDAGNQKYTVLQNELHLSEIMLSFDGFAQQIGEAMDIDLTFGTNQNNFRDILSLIPSVYQSDLAGLESAGTLQIDGAVKGLMKGESYPSFEVQLTIRDGMFKHPESPAPLRNFNVDLTAGSPGGSLDNTVVDLKKFHAEIGEEPFDMTLMVKTPVTDPHIKLNAAGNISLQDIGGLIDPEGVAEMKGRVTSDVYVEGNMSSIENNAYNRIKAQGDVSVRDFSYSDPEMPETISIREADLRMSPGNVRLNSFSASMGNSDVRANGYLDGVLAFLLNKGTLAGNLDVASNVMDLNPWLEGGTGDAGSSTESQMRVFEVPEGIDFTLKSAFDEVLYGKLSIRNAGGVIKLKDKKLQLIDLKMNLLGGTIMANGVYENPDPASARSFFDLDIDDLSIPAAYENFMTFRKFLPIAENLDGKLGAKLELTAHLDSTMTPVYNSIFSRGSATLKEAALENFKPLEKAAGIVKLDRLKKLSVKNVDASYKVMDGRFILSPMNFKIDDTEYVLSGSNGLDMSLNYLLKMKVPSGKMGSEANSRLNELFNRKVDLLSGDHVVFDVSFTGNVNDPDVSVSGSDIVKGAGAKLTDIAKDELLKRAGLEADTTGSVIDKQKQEMEDLKKEMQKRAEEEKAKLKKQASGQLKKLFKKE